MSEKQPEPASITRLLAEWRGGLVVEESSALVYKL
jgi:hypothetical protein